MPGTERIKHHHSKHSGQEHASPRACTPGACTPGAWPRAGSSLKSSNVAAQRIASRASPRHVAGVLHLCSLIHRIAVLRQGSDVGINGVHLGGVICVRGSELVWCRRARRGGHGDVKEAGTPLSGRLPYATPLRESSAGAAPLPGAPLDHRAGR